MENLISGVKNFLPARKDFPVTRLVEALMDPSSASTQALQDTDEYLLFDPRSGGRSSARPSGMAASGQRARQNFHEAVVFVVGGGSLVEYGNMSEWVARTGQASAGGAGGGGAGGAGAGATSALSSSAALASGQKSVTYGSTEILAPAEFVKALSELGGGSSEPSLI